MHFSKPVGFTLLLLSSLTGADHSTAAPGISGAGAGTSASADARARAGTAPVLESPMQFLSPAEGLRRVAAAPDRAALGPVAPAGHTGVAWQFLGPQPIEDEAYSGNATTGGNASGRVCALVVDPGNGAVVYAAAAQGGVWKTTDAGAHWLPLTDGLTSLASGALALDPLDPTVVWYGTGEQNLCIDCFVGDGLFRSTNGGGAWSKIATKTTVGGYISRVALPPAGGSIVLVASEKGIVRSANGGSTWGVTLSGNYATDIVFDTASSPTAYAALYGLGIYKSGDLGATWTHVLTPALNTIGRINLATAASTPGTVYASCASATTYGLYALYRSTDFGATWTPQPAPDFLTGKSNNGQGFYDNAIVVDPHDANSVYAAGSDPVISANALIVSTTGGSAWTGRAIGVDGGRLHPDHHALVFGPDGVLWDANDGGVWSSADAGLHWTNHNATLGVTQFYTVALNPSDGSVLLGGTQDNGTIGTDTGTAWTQVITGDGGPCFFDPQSSSTFYTTYIQLRSMLKWVGSSPPVEITGGAAHNWDGDPADWANGVFAPDPNVSGTFWTGTNRLWLSGNSGTSWTAVSSPLIRTPAGTLRSIGFGLGTPHARYIGSSDGAFTTTTDTSSVYWDRSAGLPTRPIPDIAVYPSDWRSLYVCADTTAGGRVFNTNTDGRAWTNVTGDLPSGLRAMSLAADFRVQPPTVFLGTDHGVYFTTNGGAHWIVTSLPAVAVYDLAVDTARNMLVAATHGRGMWTLPLGVTAAPQLGESAEADARHGALLHARGVTNGSGAVRFTLASTASIRAEVFAVNGRRVAVADLGQLGAGTHTWTWAAAAPGETAIAAGIYRVRLHAGGIARDIWSVRVR